MEMLCDNYLQKNCFIILIVASMYILLNNSNVISAAVLRAII